MSERELKEVGVVTHYYTRISVAIVKLKDTLSLGDKILIRGTHPSPTNFEQTVESMQVEHEDVASAKPGQSIGLKVNERVRKGDKVYRVVS